MALKQFESNQGFDRRFLILGLTNRVEFLAASNNISEKSLVAFSTPSSEDAYTLNSLDYKSTFCIEIPFCIHIKEKIAHIFSFRVSLYYHIFNFIQTLSEVKMTYCF